MQARDIQEIGAWYSLEQALHVVQLAADLDDLGVIAFGSFGTCGDSEDLEPITALAYQSGVLVGYMHTCEPHLNTAEAEAKFLLERASRYELGLGIWLDIEETGGMATYELSQWLEDLLAIVQAFEPRVGVICDAPMANELGYKLEGLRLACWGTPSDESQKVWASGRVESITVDGHTRLHNIYSVHNPRGVMPPWVRYIEEGPQDDVVDPDSEMAWLVNRPSTVEDQLARLVVASQPSEAAPYDGAEDNTSADETQEEEA